MMLWNSPNQLKPLTIADGIRWAGHTRSAPDYNPRELFGFDDADILRQLYDEGRSAASWARDEDDRHIAGLLEVARSAATYSAKEN